MLNQKTFYNTIMSRGIVHIQTPIHVMFYRYEVLVLIPVLVWQYRYLNTNIFVIHKRKFHQIPISVLPFGPFSGLWSGSGLFSRNGSGNNLDLYKKVLIRPKRKN